MLDNALIPYVRKMNQTLRCNWLPELEDYPAVLPGGITRRVPQENSVPYTIK